MVQENGPAAGEGAGGSALMVRRCGPGWPSEGCQDISLPVAGATHRGERPAALSSGHGAGDLEVPPPAARFVHEPYGPPPGAAEMLL